MDWKVTNVNEAVDIDENRGLIRDKRVRFTVNGGKHTTHVSMPDFDKGKGRGIVERDAKKVAAIFGEK